MAILALIAVIVLGILLSRSLGNADVGTDPSPTPFSNVSDEVDTAALVFGISDTDAISVTLDSPLSLLVNGKTFSVRTEQVSADGVWTPLLSNEDQAVWVYGTIVNYVMAIADNEQNRAVLEQLQPGDELQLSTRLGTTLTFSFDSSQLVPTTQTDIYNQTHPGITLILTGSGDESRLVVNGRHVVTENDAGSSNVVGLGETAQLENLQITVPGVTYIPERPEVPPGFAFFQVDYEIQNVGLTAFDSSLLQFTLVDDVGNQYALNPVASQVGNFPVATGFINSGTRLQATAGYQIPIGLASKALSWVVTRLDSGTQLQVTIPFTGNASTGAQNTQVVLTEAVVGSDLNSLNLTGQITNLNTQPIVVTSTDIQLVGSDGAAYLLLSTNPSLPWTVASGQVREFRLLYQAPGTDSVVFTIYNQSFQLSGFR